MTDQHSMNKIVAIIEGLVGAMGIEVSVEAEDSITKGLIFNIDIRDPYLLIGRQGSHLQALQTIVQALVAKNFGGESFVPFILDIDDYKRKREWFLKETAKQAVDRARRIAKPVALEPMPNFERKIIHAYLQENFPEVSSESAGLDPRRWVVVRVR